MMRLVTLIVTPSPRHGKGTVLSPDRELPPKTLLTQRKLQGQREELYRDLAAYCVSQYECYDLERAKDLLRTYTCTLYDALKDAYSQKISTWEWEGEIANEAVQIALACWDSFGVHPPTVYFDDSLRRAIVQHLGRPLRGFQTPPKPTSPPIVPPPQIPELPSIRGELKRLLEESRWRPEDIAEEISIEPRNVYRHLSGETVPTLVNVGKYEKALSKRLGRPVKLPTPEKRQNVIKMPEKRQ